MALYLLYGMSEHHAQVKAHGASCSYYFSLLTRESIGKEAELEMKLAIVSNALMKVSNGETQKLKPPRTAQ